MGHFYDSLGIPKHRIIGTNGVERDTHIGDARKHGWNSSVTTITNILSKEGLKFWQDNQLLDAAFNYFMKSEGQSENEWRQEILEQANKVSKDSQKEGQRIHGLLESYFKSPLQNTINVEIVPILELLDKEFGVQPWISEDSFSHKDGFAGQVDLHSKNAIIDFKTKIKPVVDKSCVTPEYLMQIAAYRKGLDLPFAKCYNLFISTSSGKLYLHEYKEEDLERGLMMFESLLAYYNLVNKL